ncbi:MAG: hypothetical protein ACRD0Z_05910 [Acidimicrobiales bacterium]
MTLLVDRVSTAGSVEEAVGARRSPVQARPATRLRTAAPLTLVLLVQGLLSLKNRPFASRTEALALYRANLDLQRLTGSATDHFGAAGHMSAIAASTYVYPVWAAMASSLGGLTGARLLSLVLMMSSTVLVCGLTRRLFGDLAGVCAACLFVAASPTLVLGDLAQYDAMSVFLLCLSARFAVTAVTTTDSRSLLAPALSGATAALCAATGPLGLLFVPVVAVLLVVASAARPAAITWADDGAGTTAGPFLRLGSFAAGIATVAVLFIVVLPLLGPKVTLSVAGWGPRGLSQPIGATLGGTLWYIGPALVLSLVAMVSLGFCRGRRRRRTLLVAGVLLAGGVLGPVYAELLHGGPTLLDLDACSLVFASCLGGEAIRRFFAWWKSRAVIPVVAGILAVLSFAGATFGSNFTWTSEQALVSTLSKVVRPGDNHYLLSEPVVPEYYLESVASPKQFLSTNSLFSYAPAGATSPVHGLLAYREAIGAGYFQAIALPADPGHSALLASLASDIAGSKKYALHYSASGTAARPGWYVWTLVRPSPLLGKAVSMPPFDVAGGRR